jgi:tripartite-type tricarboxylate transporter receptor subunit TctC
MPAAGPHRSGAIAFDDFARRDFCSLGVAVGVRRRSFLRLAAGAAALPVLPRLALADEYPARPVHVLVGFVAGGAADTVARLAADWLSRRLGQQFIVDNRAGAATNIATEVAVQSPPDGYTLLLVTASNAINATLYSHLNFDFLHDMAPISGVIRVPNVMVANPQLPVKSVPEFIAYAKANPGKINMASGGIGSTPHVAGELFKMMAGVNLIHVPYRGDAPALVDLMGGQVQVMFDLMSASIGFIKAGKLRALAVTSAARFAAMPDLPTVGEFLPGYEATSFEGLAAPIGTPAAIVDRLNKEMNAAFADADFKARLADLGGEGLPGSPAEFRSLIADETVKWGKVVKFASLRAE